MNTYTNELISLVEKQGLRLDEVKWTKMGHQKMLQVNVYHPAEPVNMEMIELLSEAINDFFDNHADLNEEFILDIGSSGSQREIKTEEDFELSLNRYVHIYLNEPVLKSTEFEGYIRNVDKDSIEIEINLKGRIKQIKVERKQIKKIHFEVKV